ncbi:MAG: hypothetical protein M0P10_06220 [Sphaerochaetaceae bacterium]|nr:hypothetical protein [Sphaerochaetaceae bacterium]
MLNEIQIKILHNFMSGVANKYGALSIEDIDVENIDSALKGNDKEAILKAISHLQDRRFVVDSGNVYSTQKPKEQLDQIFESYKEYEKPENVTMKDVEDYIDLENLPETESFKALKEYCVEKSQLEDKIERAYRFNWTFYFSANGITLSNFDKLSPFVSQYFDIEDNLELKKLCITALENQVSWMSAGHKGNDNKFGTWFSNAAEKANCNVLDVYGVHSFCQSAASYYGYIQLKDAYRIYKAMHRDDCIVTREQFDGICAVASDAYPIYQIEGAITSTYLMEEDSLKYWKEVTKKAFIAEDPERTEADALYLSILLLIKEQGKKQYSVPTASEFAHYASPTYVKPTTPYNRLVGLLSKNNENFNILLFNRDFNFYSNMVCEDVAKLRADTLEVLGINKLEESEKMSAIKYLEQAISLVPCWALRGFSQLEEKKKK